MSADVQLFLKDIQSMISELAGVETIKNNVIKALSSGANPIDVVDVMSKGLEDVGGKYERGEYFLSELIMAGIVASEITSILKPHLEKSAKKPAGKVVIGTVKGDLHDIGKNIVIAMLSSAGFRIIDLGIDVPSEKFVDAVKREKPDILGMSCLLTIAMNEMKTVIDKLKEVNLRGDVKVMVGGRPITPQFSEEIGADAYGSNAVEAVKIAKMLMGNVAVDSLAIKSKKEVVEEAKECIRKASSGGGHFLTSSNSWYTDAKLENCLAMVKTGRKHGKYPISI